MLHIISRFIIYLIILALASKSYATPPLEKGVLPKNLSWENGEELPEFADLDAKKGGTFKTFIMSFPPTLRVIGPDSNSSFRSEVLNNFMGLVNTHPNLNDKFYPALAESWAFDKDHKTIYFKLNPKATWSDGTKVSIADFTFALEVMTSPHVQSPWHQNYIATNIEKIVQYDEHTFAIVGKVQRSNKELMEYNAIAPWPKHFYKTLDKDFVKKYNWAIVPNNGPYQIDKIQKGKSISFTRNKNWWAKDLKFYRGRYNIDKVNFKVVRDMKVVFEYFKKGNIDFYPLTIPSDWYSKDKEKVFTQGYAHRIWFYNDMPRSQMGFWPNESHELFKDINIRLGLAHSLNFEKVIETVLRNDYARLQSGWVGYGKYSNTKIKARKFDLKLADKYFKKSGWKRGSDGIRVKDGKRLTINVIYGNNTHSDRMTVLKEEAKKAGVELNIQLVDPSAVFKIYLEKKHEIAYMGWSTGSIPQFWESYHSKNANKPQTNNISNTSDPKIDQLIDLYDVTFDEKKKISLSHQIQQLIHDRGSFIPGYSNEFYREGYWRYWRLPKIPGTKTAMTSFDISDSNGGLFWFDKDKFEETKKAKKENKSLPVIVLKDKTYLK